MTVKNEIPKWLTDKYIVHIIRCIPSGKKHEVDMRTISKEEAKALAKTHPNIIQLKTDFINADESEMIGKEEGEKSKK